jgi:hypothetical protein
MFDSGAAVTFAVTLIGPQTLVGLTGEPSVPAPEQFVAYVIDWIETDGAAICGAIVTVTAVQA